MAQTLPNSQVQLVDCAGREGDRLDAPAPIRYWHLSSLDAPTVAIVWSLAFAWSVGVRLPLWVPVLLGLAAWAVYVGDRLLDARAAGELNTLAERHRFHHRHRRVLVPLAIAAACAAGCVVFTLMPAAARERNSLLGVSALVYFTRVHSARGLRSSRVARIFPLKKELLVGLIFTAACVLPTISRMRSGPDQYALLSTALAFAMLAWLNCHAIDRWESAEGRVPSRVLAEGCLLAAACLLGAGCLWFVRGRFAILLAAAGLSSLLLALLDRLRDRMTPVALRAAADLVLLTPLGLLWR